uniref:LAGLIDADG homing endonuclease n=1 Tax=Marophrys sp. SRT127 TaxID=2488311 RepID=A0A455RHX5_9EUKA|nr:LAGLIDADG homing endonuclease [Marophrys sp. SRT127]
MNLKTTTQNIQTEYLDKNFIDWFVGFSEGDGSFGVNYYKNKGGVVGKSPRHDFIINQKDPQALYTIQSMLGIGSVSKYQNTAQGTTYFRYIVSDLNGIARLIQIFDGRLVLNKTKRRFHVWAETYRKRPGAVRHKACSSSVTNASGNAHNSAQPWGLDNAWLSGLIDAEGCFNVSDPEKSTALSLRFILDQKGEGEFLRTVVNIFQAGTIEQRRACADMERYVLCTSRTLTSTRNVAPAKKRAFDTLFAYLARYPLITAKRVASDKMEQLWRQHFSPDA